MFETYRRSLIFPELEYHRERMASSGMQVIAPIFSPVDSKMNRAAVIVSWGGGILCFLGFVAAFAMEAGTVRQEAVAFAVILLGFLIMRGAPWFEGRLQRKAFADQWTAYRKEWGDRDDALELLKDSCSVYEEKYPIVTYGKWHSASPTVRFAKAIGQPLAVEILDGENWIPSETISGAHWKAVREFMERLNADRARWFEEWRQSESRQRANAH